MIDQILAKVKANIGGKLATETGISEDQVPTGLQSVSDTVMEKAKGYVDSGDLMKLKDVFLDGDESDKQAFMSEVKSNISTTLGSKLGMSGDQANKFTELSIPEFIKVAKAELLGEDGKFNLMTDGPRLMSFFKSGGKEAKGGLGGMFGF